MPGMFDTSHLYIELLHIDLLHIINIFIFVLD